MSRVIADPGLCPYLRQDGSMGRHGPNTCLGGCWEEPRCITTEPEGGWGSLKRGRERRRDALRAYGPLNRWERLQARERRRKHRAYRREYVARQRALRSLLDGES